MVSAGDNEIYTGSSLRGVIPYVQCVAAVFLSRVQERYRAAQWPDVHSRWCIRHMGANFHSQLKNKELTKLFKRLCSTNQEKKILRPVAKIR
jgi:hypothetical protein